MSSTMAMASGGGGGGLRSTLNPNAPLFIPASIRKLEDFSPEWYDLVRTSSGFREQWYLQNQEQGTFDDEDGVYNDRHDDVLNMLPESFDLDAFNDEVPNFEDLDEAIFQQAFVCSEDSVFVPKDAAKLRVTDSGSLLENLNMKSPNNYGIRSLTDASKKYREKTMPPPLAAISPIFNPRRIIQQPR